MDDSRTVRVPKWPFFLGDAVLLGLAWFVYRQGGSPASPALLAAEISCVLLGALLAVWPFWMEYRICLKQLEIAGLSSVAEKIQNLEAVAAHIGSATSHWQLAHENADKTAASAKEISERMSAELKDFTEFMQKLNESEKATLRLEVEKLHRAEAEWLGTLIRILDHIYALTTAAERAGQPNLTNQLRGFQNACRDAARRVGLTPFVAAAEEAFDPKRHQSSGEPKPEADSKVAETLATGYSFQGRQIRPALVKLAAAARTEANSQASAGESPDQTLAESQSSLPLNVAATTVAT